MDRPEGLRLQAHSALARRFAAHLGGRRLVDPLEVSRICPWRPTWYLERMLSYLASLTLYLSLHTSAGSGPPWLWPATSWPAGRR